MNRQYELALKISFLEQDKKDLESKGQENWSGIDHRNYVDICRELMQLRREQKE